MKTDPPDEVRHRKRMRCAALTRIGLVAAMLLPWSGCGSSTADLRASIEGTVTLDGKPLEMGRIKFVPIDGTPGPVAGGQIKNGTYKIDAAKGPAIGRNRVEINSTIKTGRQITGMTGEMVDEVTEGIPQQYNADSTLESEIRKGVNQLDFELSSEQ